MNSYGEELIYRIDSLSKRVKDISDIDSMAANILEAIIDSYNNNCLFNPRPQEEEQNGWIEI